MENIYQDGGAFCLNLGNSSIAKKKTGKDRRSHISGGKQQGNLEDETKNCAKKIWKSCCQKIKRSPIRMPPNIRRTLYVKKAFAQGCAVVLISGLVVVVNER